MIETELTPASDLRLETIAAVHEERGSARVTEYIAAGWILLLVTPAPPHVDHPGSAFVYALGWRRDAGEPVHPPLYKATTESVQF